MRRSSAPGVIRSGCHDKHISLCGGIPYSRSRGVVRYGLPLSLKRDTYHSAMYDTESRSTKIQRGSIRGGLSK